MQHCLPMEHELLDDDWEPPEHWDTDSGADLGGNSLLFWTALGWAVAAAVVYIPSSVLDIGRPSAVNVPLSVASLIMAVGFLAWGLSSETSYWKYYVFDPDDVDNCVTVVSTGPSHGRCLLHRLLRLGPPETKLIRYPSEPVVVAKPAPIKKSTRTPPPWWTALIEWLSDDRSGWGRPVPTVGARSRHDAGAITRPRPLENTGCHQHRCRRAIATRSLMGCSRTVT